MSRPRSIKSPAPSNFLKIHFNIIVQSTRRSSRWPYSFRFSHQNRVCSSPFPHTCNMLLHSHSWCDYSRNTWWVVQVMKLSIVQYPPSSITSSLLDRNIFLNTLFSNTFSLYSSLTVRDTVSLYPYLCIAVTGVIFCHQNILFHNVLNYFCFGKMEMCSKFLMHYPQYNLIRLKTSAIILSFKTIVHYYSQSWACLTGLFIQTLVTVHCSNKICQNIGLMHVNLINYFYLCTNGTTMLCQFIVQTFSSTRVWLWDTHCIVLWPDIQ